MHCFLSAVSAYYVMADVANEPKDGESSNTKAQQGEDPCATSGATTSHQISFAPPTKAPKSSSSSTPFQSTSNSTTSSPKPSREGSPVRQQHKPALPLGTRPTARSRKNSHDQSPVRGPSTAGPSIPTVPSAAAIQRALSVTGTPTLPPSTHHDLNVDPSKSSKSSKPLTPSQPPSRAQRLSSPPPAASSGSNKSVLTAARKIDKSQSAPGSPSNHVERTKQSAASGPEPIAADEESAQRSGMRTPIRGASGSGAHLETVQESSLPSTPSIGTSKWLDKSKNGGVDRPERIEENAMDEASAKEGKARAESGNESSGSKHGVVKGGDDGKEPRKTSHAPTPIKPPTIQPKKSYTQLPVKGRLTSEGPKTMTVETETVSSIPHVAVGGGAGERNVPGRTDTGGTLRPKPSTETIRPKKEKKKVVRKAPSLNAGAGGFSSRHFPLYQSHSRNPSSPDSIVPSSMGSGNTLHEQQLVEQCPISPLILGRSRIPYPSFPSPMKSAPNPDSHGPLGPPGPQRRFSSGLISFRGRTASSKADIFEAKVASAVDERDSSDSEETFVYESNPPEPLSARPHRFHSRTPSTASTLSQIDPHGVKGRQDSHHALVGKKSMKFANNHNSMNLPNDGEGTVRGPSQTGRGGGTPHHHHIGRFGRSGGHPSIFDNESPFPNAVRTSRPSTSHLQQMSPRQFGQRSPQVWRSSGNGRKAEEYSSYDLEGEGADDERAPLIGSTRGARNRRRPLPGSVRQMYATEERDPRFCGRITAFTSLGSILALLIAAIVIILVLCTKPLYEVHIRDIRNVLASESELMLDLNVHAINPNIIAIQISDLDVNLFAKSRHVGTSSAWRQQNPPPSSPNALPSFHQSSRRRRIPVLRTPADLVSQLDGIDEGTDPIDDDDPASDSQTMLLGRIYSFDSPLIFDPSPLHHHSLSSTGEVRLSKPGNRTVEGGTARWEKVLQHDFELIVRGVVKYSLPISSKIRKASLGGRVIVHPSEDDGEGAGGMRLSAPAGSEKGDEGSNVIIIRPQLGNKDRW